MPKYVHGLYGTRIYNVHCAMLQRCNNPQHHAYKDYGARGIKVCKRWMDVKNFLTDMGEPPKGMTLERKKNHIGYRLSNCVWATPKEQGNNRRTCVLLTHGGETKNVTQWAETLSVPRMLLYDRVRAGWTHERILTTPKRGT